MARYETVPARTIVLEIPKPSARPTRHMRALRLSPLVAALALLPGPATLSLAQGSRNLTGLWSFDSARRQIYIDSVNASRSGAAMSEIAAAMGMARVEGSLYELGADAQGPFLSVTDKTSRLPTVTRVSVSKSANELLLTDTATGHRYRLRPIDPLHIDLIDEQKRVVIPLTRR